MSNPDPYKPLTGPLPTYAGQTQTHHDAGPYYPSPSPGPGPGQNQITPYQQPYPQDVQPYYNNQQYPPPGGYYGQPQPMYYQQQQQPPQGYFADNRGYGYGYGGGGGGYGYQQPGYGRGGSSTEAICAGLLGALACCCCLDCLF